MERLARHAREVAIGGAVLLGVLAAPAPAQATPFMDTFTGEVTVDRNSCGCCTHTQGNVLDLTFFGDDQCHPCSYIRVPATVDCLPQVNSGATAACPVPFTFTACIPCGEQNDTWDLDICYPSGATLECPGPSSLCVNPGTFIFIPSTGHIFESGSFFVTNQDPFSASGQVLTVTPQGGAAAAPEIDGRTAAAPVAVLLATLLALSDPRKKT